MKQLEKIFYAALRIKEPAERDAFLRRKCGADIKLKAEVEKLLWADSAVGDFFTPDCAEGTWAAAIFRISRAGQRAAKSGREARRRAR